jgi:alkaline phosphatase
MKLSAEGFANKLNSEPASEVQRIFRTYAGFELNDAELKALYHCGEYKNSPVPAGERSSEGIEASLYSGSLSAFVARLLASKTCFGFTTGGHTGEEVFLAAYHPEGTIPSGMLTNIELNDYLCRLYGIDRDTLDALSFQYFARHTDVFSGYSCEIVPAKTEDGFPTLVVKNGKKQLNIRPFTNRITSGRKGDKEILLRSVVVYVDANRTFYLPENLVEYIK